jgi:choline-sulfatase
VIFEQAYSDSTICAPARMALLTGLHHHRLPTQVNGLALREGFFTVAHALGAVGYDTALIGKMHFAPVRAHHGFATSRIAEHMSGLVAKPGAAAETDDYHYWLRSEGHNDWRFEREARGQAAKDGRPPAERLPTIAEHVHPTAWIEREAVRLLRDRDPDRPLFLVVSFLHPHAPLNPPEPYRSMYRLRDAQLPDDGFEANARLPAGFQASMERAPRKVDPDNARPLQYQLTRVRSLVNQIDDAVGRIVSQLDLPRSVLFFTSDHGDYAGHRGVLTKQPWIPFDDLARVPFFVTGHDIAGGRSISNLVQTPDFALTCLDYAGAERPIESFDGRSLRPVLSDPDHRGDPDRALALATSLGFPTLRRGDHKLIRHLGSSEEVLFDLSVDPGETVDRRHEPDHRAIGDEMARLLDRELVVGQPDLPSFVPAG